MSDPDFQPRRLAAQQARASAGRLGRIVLGYGLACAGAGVVRTLGLIAEEAWVRGFGRLVADNGWSSLFLVPVMTAVMVFIAAAPFATAFLFHAEGRGLRAPLGYVIAGAVIGPLTQGIIGFLAGAGLHPSFGLTALAAFAGGVGGWLYWIVAVRSAPPPPSSSHISDLGY